MKKLVSLVVALVMVMSLAYPCAAEEISGGDWSGCNVSPFSPADRATTFGIEAPTSTYNLHANGIYSFHGIAYRDRLWLNYYMTDCMKYHVYVNNRSSSTLWFTVRGISGGDRDFYLPAYTDTASYFSFDEMTFSVSSTDTLFCMSFEAPSNFEGWVSCGD